MNAVIAVARTEFRRTTRNRVFLVCVLLAIAVIAVVVEPIITIRTQGGETIAVIVAWRVISTFSGFGFVLAAVLGVWAIQSERREETWQALLCKPIRPWQIVVGKFIGVMSVMGGLTILLWACVHALLAISLERYSPRLDIALAYQLLSFSIPAALSLCLSLRFQPIASALVTLLLRYDILDSLFATITMSPQPAAVLFVPVTLVGAARAVAVPYDAFDLSESLRSAASILWARDLWVAAYALTVVMLLLAVAAAWLKHGELANTG
jgi:ABC-type transport system involved in multi-copper enzyme maturation permease subunit